MSTWTPESLAAFEHDIAAEFNAGRIRAPVHLDGGNERQLLQIFKQIRAQDWVLGSWRMHYKCLLKGVPPAQLKKDILAGRSITLCYPEYRVISSAIVGGVLPWAVGLAAAIKRRGGSERVYCFLGDMTATIGLFHECIQYSVGHGLLGGRLPQHRVDWAGGPLRWVIEDNQVSVSTPTAEAWGSNWAGGWSNDFPECYEYYDYQLFWPHSGAGKRVEF